MRLQVTLLKSPRWPCWSIGAVGRSIWACPTLRFRPWTLRPGTWRTARCAGAANQSPNLALPQAPRWRESANDDSGALRCLSHSSAQLILERHEIGQSLVDLHEQVGTRSFHVLVPELNNHLSESTDGPDDVDRVRFARRVGVAAHDSSSLPLGSGAPRRIARSCSSPRTGTPSSRARSALLPASSPANTAVVFFETETATLAPPGRNTASAASRF